MKGELPIARPTSGYAQLEELPEIPAWRGNNSTAPAATPTSPAAPLHLYGSAPAPAASAPAPSPNGGPPPSLALQSSLENESTQKKIKQLEDDLLFRLSNSQGNQLDDVELIEVLNVTKKTAQEVNEKLANASETNAKITETCEEYRPVAHRATLIYLSLIHI